MAGLAPAICFAIIRRTFCYIEFCQRNSPEDRTMALCRLAALSHFVNAAKLAVVVLAVASNQARAKDAATAASRRRRDLASVLACNYERP
jgi:hypothetical protein